MANTTLTNLPTVTSLNGTEPLLGVQSSTSVQITTGQIAAYTGSIYGIPTINTGDMLANISGVNALPTGVSLSQFLDYSVTSTQGSVMYRDVSGWTAITPGILGQALTTNGPNANVQWRDSPGGGTVVQITAGTNLSATPVNPITASGTINTVMNPAFTTSVTTPSIYGGSSASQTLLIQSTTGVGTSDSIVFKVGNNGAITAMTIASDGTVTIPQAAIDTTSITVPLLIGGTTASSTLTLESTSGAGTSDAIIFKTGSQTERMRIRSDGGVGIGGTGNSSVGLYLQKNITGATTSYGLFALGSVQNDVTSAAYNFLSQTNIASGTAVTSYAHFRATEGTISGSMTNQLGFVAESDLISATANYGFRANNTAAVGAGKTAYGFYSLVNTATGGGTTYGFYAAGTANNYFAGNVGIGTTSPATLLHVSGSSTTAIGRIANTGPGATSFDGSGAGLELLAAGMNLTQKYTPAIKFGSTDPDFTTTNPKFGASIIASAVQTQSSDTTGGMNLEFWTAPANPGTGSGLVERMRIDSSGNVIVGNSTTAVITGLSTPQFQVQGTTTGAAGLSVHASDTTSSGGWQSAKSRGTLSAPTIVNSGDNLGQIRFAGYDGSGFIRAAEINGQSDGTPGINDMPGRLVFSTTADGASSPTERMRIDSSGNVGIGNTPSGTYKFEVTGSGYFSTTLTVGTSITSPYYIANGATTGSRNQGAYAYGTMGYSDTNVLLSLQSSVNNYNELVIQNTNSGTTASTNIIVSNDLGTASTYFGEFGMNSSGFTGTGSFSGASNVYLTSTSSDLVIGTTTANAIRFVVNSGTTDALLIRSDGNVSIGGSGAASTSLYLQKDLSSATSYGVFQSGQFQSSVINGYSFNSSANVATGATLTLFSHFRATEGTISGTITNQVGFDAVSDLISATNNFGFRAQNTAAVTTGKTAYGFYSLINIATGGGTTWGFYGAGTAGNYLAGSLGIGTTTNVGGASPTTWLQIAAGTSTVSPVRLTSGTNLGTAAAGAIEYNGTAVLATPVGSERGIVTSPQYYVNNATRTGPAAAATFVNILPANPSLTASTRYAFEIYFAITKTSANACTGAIGFSVTGTAPAALSYEIYSTTGAAQTTVAAASLMSNYITTGFGTAVVATAASAAAANTYHTVLIKGTVDTGAGAITSFAPQFQYSTGAPTASTFQVGAYMYIYPLSATGAATSVGTWA